MRLLTSGLGRLPGDSVAATPRHFVERLDRVRTGLCLEPRGHRGMLIAMLTDPVTPDADFGLLFMYPGGDYVSCGEATIGADTVAVGTGLVARQGDGLAETEMAGVPAVLPRDDGHRPHHQPAPLRSRRSAARGVPPVRVLVLGGGIAGVTDAYRTVGVELHVYPAKGYSSTFPIKVGGRRPTSRAWGPPGGRRAVKQVRRRRSACPRIMI